MPAAALLVPLGGQVGERPRMAAGTGIAPIAPFDRAGPVTDLSGIYAPGEERQLADALDALRAETGLDFAIVTVPNRFGLAERRLSYELRRGWPIGDPRANDGLLLLVQTREKRVLMEGGKGLRPTFDKAFYAAVIDTMTPLMARGRMAEAARRAVDMVALRARGEAR